MNVRLTIFGFVAVSFIIHGAVVLAMSVPDMSLSAASPPPAMVSQGNSFANLAQGAQSSSPDVTPPTEVVDQAETSPSPTAAAAVTPSQIETASAGVQLQPEELQQTPADIAATATVLTLTATQPVEPAQVTATQPAQIAAAQPQTLEALPDVEVRDVTADTIRPPGRPANLGEAPPPPQQTQQARQTPPTPQGNSNENTRRGAATASQNTGQAAQSGQGQQVDQAAVAAARQAAANYGNVVVRRIQRTRRENYRGRGRGREATVGFGIETSGQLAWVRIESSSGDAELDELAVRHIRRAAPFPAPPAGAGGGYSWVFEGR